MINRKLIGLAFTITALSASATEQQSQQSPAVEQKSSRSAVSAFSQAMEDAKRLARNNNLDAAEERAIEMNPSPRGTSHWHLETIQKLNELAGSLARQGNNDDLVMQLAEHGLRHAAQAGAGETDPKVKAQAKAAAALIYLNYFGDMASAISSYRAAATLDPDDAGIRQALTRLVSTDEKLRARVNNQKP